MKKRLLIIAVVAIVSLLFVSESFAINAGDTSDPRAPYGPGISDMQASGFGPLKLSFDATTFKRDLKPEAGISNSKIEGQWYLARLGYTFFDRVEPYVRFGGSHLMTKWDQYNKDLKVKGEIGVAGGAGIKVLAFEFPKQRIRFSADANFIYTDPGVRKAYVNVPGRTISAAEFKILEWQVSGLVGIELPLNYDKRDPAAICSLLPYAGVGYAASNVKAKFTHEGTNYDIDNAKNDKKYILIAGMDIHSPKNVSLNAEGRFIGETAVSGGGTLKF